MRLLFLIFAIISSSCAKISPENIVKQKQKDFVQKQIYKEQIDTKNKSRFYNIDLLDINKTSKFSENCIQINKINILDIRVFKIKDINKILDRYLNRCNTISDLKNLTNEITNKYIKKGYTTSKAYLKIQDLSDGVLDISILEGKVEKVLADDINMVNLYNGYKGRILNLRDLEVALQQGERLQSQALKMELIPSSLDEHTIIKVSNSSDKNRIYGNIGINNYGFKKTGKYQIYNNFNLENPFKINDILNLNLNFTNKVFKSNDNTLGASISYSVPYERFLFDIYYNYSNYEQINNDEFGTIFKTDGSNNSKGINLSYKAFHSLDHTLEFILRYDNKKSKNFLNNIKLDLQSYSSSSLGIGFRHSYKGGEFDYYSQLLTHKGVDGSKDKEASAKIYYDKYVVDLGFNRYFNTDNYLKYNFYLRGQYSNDELFGSDEISMGGIYSVRGFKNTGLSGSSGFYTRNELSVQYKIKDAIFMPYLAVDYGYVKKDKNSIFGKITGSSIGSRIYLDRLNLELFYNIPLRDTDYTKEHSSKFFGFNIVYNY
ncbi:ShlB/FhaC/HecB family hemolysin secretion/activation protein [Campylobacter pinnipediorum]|uniref:ShlB/FhaC/HecB family hemolysin secretion/activation protein n=1 Tax=Campylobacter pinnipediorum TaxID=1965231 RepID=UPI00084D844E|nr:ShlB/FhaC/HecB family hemolysin secretion/activation protein [Campylobacter pinnipediorum]